MPSPVGHALGGLIVALALHRPQHEVHEGHEGNQKGLRALRAYVVWCIVAACLPDIDFAWGRHNMETHSLTFAVVLGLVVMAWQHSPRLAVACALSAGTHVLFDWLGSDDSPPLGVMALWPFSNEFYFAHAYVFATISRRYWLPGFLAHNAMSVLRELAILLPVVMAIQVLRQRRNRHDGGSG